MLITLILGAEILFGFLFQTTVFPHLAIGGAVPNLLMIITVAAAYQRGRLQGMSVGFVCGILLDIAAGEVLGVYALFFLLIGYANGHLSKFYIEHDLFVPLGLVAVSQFSFSFLVYVFRFLIRGRLNVFKYITGIMLPSTLYTVIVAVLLYRLLDYAYLKIIVAKEEKNNIV